MVVEWRDKRRESGGEIDEEGQGQREDAEDEWKNRRNSACAGKWAFEVDKEGRDRG